MIPGRQRIAAGTGPAFRVVHPLSDFTYVVVSSSPTAEGRYWTYVDAIDQEEAMELGARELPAPSLAFRLPTQRIRRLAKLLLTYGAVAGLAATLLLPVLTFHFRRSGAGFVVLSWGEAFGYAVLFELMVLLLVLSYLAVLDFVCAHVGYRTLRERSKVAPDGHVLEGPELEDVMEAFGPERVSRIVRLVNRSFGAGLLLVLALGLLTR